jgi:hypothetical protein
MGEAVPLPLYYNRACRRDRGELLEPPVHSILTLPALFIGEPCALATVAAMASIDHTAPLGYAYAFAWLCV